MMWKKLSLSPLYSEWRNIRDTAKCVCYVSDGYSNGVYWSEYDTCPNRNLIETVLYHDSVNFTNVPEGIFKSYQQINFFIKTLDEDDIEEEIKLTKWHCQNRTGRNQ